MFPCSGCGICCQNISKIDELKSFDLGNGVCKYLNKETNQCLIYDHRPDICNVDKMYEKEYYRFFSKEVFYRENAKVCNDLQEFYKIRHESRIIIEGE